MPWTLHRYILRELLKLLVPITLVLIGLLSFVAALKPMSEGLLSAASLAKFLGYTSPTMLALALPFAGALASTLVFLRMASDNEVVACAASGMSYRTVLLPAAILGLVLTMGLFLLSNFVLPRFYRAATQTVQADMVTALVTQLNRNQPFDRFESTVIYADRAEQQPAPTLEDTTIQPSKLIRLYRVAFLEFDNQGNVRRDVTANMANALVFHGTGGRTWVKLQLQNAMLYDPERQVLFHQEEHLNIRPLRVPTPFHDSPQFFTWFELQALARNPDTFEPIQQLTDNLAEAIAAERLRQELRNRLGSSGGDSRGEGLTLHGPRAGERYIFNAPSTGTSGNVHYLRASGGEPAEVVYRSPKRPEARRIEAQRIALRVNLPRADMAPTVHATLYGARIYDPRLPGDFTERSELALPPLKWPRPLMQQREQREATTLLSLAEQARYDEAEDVNKAEANLNDRLLELARQIKSQLHQRGALAVACLLLLLLGGVLSIHMRHQMPLVVFFWSFLLAIVNLILIYVGENIASGTKFPMPFGLSMVWIGNVAIMVVIGWVYCRLARN